MTGSKQDTVNEVQEKLNADAFAILKYAVNMTTDPALLNWCLVNDILKLEAVARLQHLVDIGMNVVNGTEKSWIPSKKEDTEEPEEEVVEMPKSVIAAAQLVLIRIDNTADGGTLLINDYNKWSIACAKTSAVGGLNVPS